MPGENALDGGPLYAFALAVDQPQLQHPSLATNLDVGLHRARHLAGRERMQVESASMGSFTSARMLRRSSDLRNRAGARGRRCVGAERSEREVCVFCTLKPTLG